jgi:hypothetical protein
MQLHCMHHFCVCVHQFCIFREFDSGETKVCIMTMNQANLMQSTFITATVLRIRDAGVCVMDVGDEQTITTDAPPQDVPAPASVPESQDDGGA